MPGAIGRNRSASSAVAVRRGSITTILAPRSRLLATIRWYSTGWHQAVFEPTSTIRSALIEVFVVAGHDVGAEGAAMAGDGRSHAQPRIGVDVGRAEEALHQLVGDVIVFGQQLPGEIKGNCIGSVLCIDVGKAVRHATSAASHVTRASLPSAPRNIGCSSRPLEPERLSHAAPLEQSRPKLAGCSGSPVIVAPPMPSGLASTPQPTPQ